MNEQLIEQYKPTEVKVFSVPQTQMLLARFSSDGKLLLAAGCDSQIHRWSLDGAEHPALAPVAGHGGWVTGLVCHPGEAIAYSADSWGKLQAWNGAAETPQPLWQVEAAHDGWIQCLAISADGQQLATCSNNGQIRV